MRLLIAEENPAVDPDSFPSNPSGDLEKSANIIGLVADAGVPTTAVPLVASTTSRVVGGRARHQPVTRGDVFSHIERSCQR